MDSDIDAGLLRPISRRAALRLSGGVAAGLLTAGTLLRPINAAAGGEGAAHAAAGSSGSLPVEEMEDILRAQGTLSNGVLTIGIDRTDIGTVTLRDVAIKPSFQINGSLTFQPIAEHGAFFNGDLPLKPDEVNPVIDAIVANGLVFQAEHQHFYDFDPPVWFIHWRGTGDPITLARAVHRVVAATDTPLPQTPPPHPTTPLDEKRLQDILHGYRSDVGADGVVTVYVARREAIYIGGIRVLPDTNIATNIAFEPLNASGSRAAAAPDFGMIASEINNVMRVMRSRGWDIGCLYNQETDEHPQLFFSHQFKVGDPYALAREIRLGLDQTNTF